MRKSIAWQLAVIVLIVFIATFLALNIEHPAWVRNLFFWRPTGQRDIALRKGLDLEGGLQIVLVADVAEGQGANTMEAVRDIIESRVSDLELTRPIVHVQDEHRILVQLPGLRERYRVTETIQAMGLVEFFGAGYQDPTSLIGTFVETTLDQPPTEEPTTPPITPTIPTTPVFETVLSSYDLTYIAPRRTDEGEYTVDFLLTQEATAGFTAYTSAYAGQLLCVALDKEVVSCAGLPDTPLQGGGGIPVRLSDEDAQNISAVLRYGPLPVPLQVEKTELLEPTLGGAVIQRSGRAMVIGLIAVLLFLLLHYRLLGALVDLSLVIFALLSLVLCKVIPLPLTLPSVTGFAIASLLTIGGQLVTFERLREETRAGSIGPRAIETGLTRAWPSVRDTHTLLLVVSIAMWYLGTTYAADAIHWMGVALLTGILISLFITTVVTRALIQVMFNAARKWPSERQWMLGI